MMRNKRKADLLMLSAAFLWSTGGVFVKVLSLPAATINFYRCLIGAVFLIPFVESWKVPRKPAFPICIMSMAIVSILYVVSTNLTTAGAAVMLQYTAPIWVFILSAVFLDERITRRNIFPLIVSGVGVYLFFYQELDSSRITGNLVALLAGLIFSIEYIALKKLKDNDPVFLMFTGMMMTAILVTPFALNNLSVSGNQILLLGCMGVFQYGMANVLFTKALKTLPTQEASLINLVEPVANPILVFIIVGEALTGNMMLGGALILGALIFRFIGTKE